MQGGLRPFWASRASFVILAQGVFLGQCMYTGTRPGLTAAIRAGKGWRGRAPRCSATQLAARRDDPGQTRRSLNHLNHTPPHTTHTHHTHHTHPTHATHTHNRHPTHTQHTTTQTLLSQPHQHQNTTILDWPKMDWPKSATTVGWFYW